MTVVSPEITAKIAAECFELGLPPIWMQPGTWTEEIVARARDYG